MINFLMQDSFAIIYAAFKQRYAYNHKQRGYGKLAMSNGQLAMDNRQLSICKRKADEKDQCNLCDLWDTGTNS